jgi:hypothetical protein
MAFSGSGVRLAVIMRRTYMWPTTEKKSTKITLDSVLLHAVTGHPAHEVVFIPFRPEGEQDIGLVNVGLFQASGDIGTG